MHVLSRSLTAVFGEKRNRKRNQWKNTGCQQGDKSAQQSQ